MLKKYILAAILIAASVIGGYGCMEKKREYRDINEGALEYMEQRYGETFKFVGAHGLFYSKNSRSIMVSCASFPGKEIRVDIIKDGKNEKYRDNYMRYYFADQVNEFILNIAKEYFDDVTFRISIFASTIDSSIDFETTFEEYIHNKYSVYGHMEIGESNEDTIREFADELVRRGIKFTIGINIPSTGEGYDIQYLNDFDEIDFYRRK